MRATLLLLLLLSGCSSGIAPGKLPGEYLAEFTFAREKLELFANGNYRQTITVREQQVVHEGAWKYLQSGGTVVLETPLLVDDPFGRFNSDYRIPAKGSWYLSVEQWIGPITLNWNDDAGVRFSKVR